MTVIYQVVQTPNKNAHRELSTLIITTNKSDAAKILKQHYPYSAMRLWENGVETGFMTIGEGEKSETVSKDGLTITETTTYTLNVTNKMPKEDTPEEAPVKSE